MTPVFPYLIELPLACPLSLHPSVLPLRFNFILLYYLNFELQSVGPGSRAYSRSLVFLIHSHITFLPRLSIKTLLWVSHHVPPFPSFFLVFCSFCRSLVRLFAPDEPIPKPSPLPCPAGTTLPRNSSPPTPPHGAHEENWFLD